MASNKGWELGYNEEMHYHDNESLVVHIYEKRNEIYY